MKRQVYIAIFLAILFVTAVIAVDDNVDTSYDEVVVNSVSAEAKSGYDDLGTGGIIYRSYANTLHIIWTSGYEGWLPAEYKMKISVSEHSSGIDWRHITLAARGTVSGGYPTTLDKKYSTKEIGSAAEEIAYITISETTSKEFSWDWSTNSSGEYTVTGYGSGSFHEPAFSIGGVPTSGATGCDFAETKGSTTTFTVDTDELVVSGQF